PEMKGTFAFPLATPQAEASPGQPYVAQSDLYGFQNRTLWSTSLKGEIELTDAIGLTSITAYQHHRSAVLRDLDGTALPVISANDAERGRQFTQELRLASTAPSPFQWLAGLYYFKD